MRGHIITLILKLSARLPLFVLHWFGQGLGRLLLLTNSEQKRVARINLSRCFPQLTTRQQNQLLRDCMIETGKTFFETGRIWLADKSAFFAMIREVRGEEHLTTALARGKGVILISPHLGNWEVVGLYSSSRSPITSLYRPPRLASLDNMIRLSRERFGAHLVPTNAKGVRALYEALANNKLIGILPDQDPRDSGQFAPFFGIPANTMTLLSRLLQKSRATALLTFAERLPRGRGFAIHYQPVPAELYDEDLNVSLAALNRMVEASIHQIPAQYQWGYKRFRTRPPGEGDFYKRTG